MYSVSSDKLTFTLILREWAEVFMRRSMRDFIEFSKASGLTMTQMSALMQLFYAGTKGVSDIAQHLGVSDAAASQMVERLVQQKILERSEDKQDRRFKKVSLTDKGKRLIEDGIESRRRWMELLTQALTAEQQETIGNALIVLTEAAKNLDQEKPQ